MPPEHILPVLYDLSLTIGGETRLKPLLTRFLRRMLYHTSFPAGIVILDLSQAGGSDMASGRIGAVVGDYALLEQEGQLVSLPAALLHGNVMRQEDGEALLKGLSNGRYRSFLRLPIEGTGVILLLAPVMPESELPLAQMFQPVLARLAIAIRLCRESEARTAELIDNSRDLEAQRYLMASVYDSLHAAVMITNEAGNIIAANPAFTRITGYASSEVLGRNPRLLSSGRHDHGFYCAMWQQLLEQNFWQGEIWNRRKNGEVYPEWLSITKVHRESGNDIHYVGIFSDISEQKSAQQRIEYLAHHDQLTGLPNRALLRERFERASAHSMRAGEQVALMFLDLDNFKYVNDVFGHSMGDKLLCLVTHRLHACLREVDILSRLGGDEFVAVLTGIKEASAVAMVAEKIVLSLRNPFDIDGNVFHIGVSIGISLHPTDAADFDALLKHADMAMYQAKANGRDTYNFFTQAMNRLIHDRLDMERKLRNALDTGAFLLHYQPQVDLASQRIIGIEALLRWPIKGDGMMQPALFIPAAEECGLIVPLGEWVIQEACRCAQRCHVGGMADMVIAVNLSAVQLLRGNIVETVRKALAESGLPPHCLELELTESMLIQDTEHTLEIVRQLKSLGVQLSLDDFGTGYSNVSYLKRLKVDKLKIDQSFVRDLSANSESVAIVRAMIEMGRSLNLNIIAEGVETETQAALLRELACHHAQGFLFHRPIPEQDLAALLGAKVTADFPVAV